MAHGGILHELRVVQKFFVKKNPILYEVHCLEILVMARKKQTCRNVFIISVCVSLGILFIVSTPVMVFYGRLFSQDGIEPTAATQIIQHLPNTTSYILRAGRITAAMTSGGLTTTRYIFRGGTTRLACSGNKTQDDWSVLWVLEDDNGNKELISKFGTNEDIFEKRCSDDSLDKSRPFSYLNLVYTTERKVHSQLVLTNIQYGCQHFTIQCILPHLEKQKKFQIVHKKRTMAPDAPLNDCKRVCGEVVVVPPLFAQKKWF